MSTMTPEHVKQVVVACETVQVACEAVQVAVRQIRRELKAIMREVEDASGVTACRAAMQANRVAGLDVTVGCSKRGFPCDGAGLPCVALGQERRA